MSERLSNAAKIALFVLAFSAVLFLIAFPQAR